MTRIWALESARLGDLRARLQSVDLHALAAAPPVPLVDSTIVDGVAVIPITGMMLGSDTLLDRFIAMLFGGTITASVTRAVAAAAADPQVSAIVLVVESPGGDANRVPELADAVLAAARVKPVVAHIQGIGASGAFYAASGASRIIASRSAMVGSIGVYGVVQDLSGAAEQAGIEVHVISSSPPLKGAGVTGTEISPAQLAAWQEEVDAMAEIFIEDVARGRGVASAKVQAWATGAMWIADEAKALGLVDEVGSLEAAMAGAKGGRGSGSRPLGADLAGRPGARLTQLDMEVLGEIEQVMEAVKHPEKAGTTLPGLRDRAIAESKPLHPAEAFQELHKRAESKFPRLYDRDAHAAVEKLITEDPEAYRTYRQAHHVKTSARTELANAVILNELAPAVAFFREDGVGEAEAVTAAFELIPAMKLTRDALIAKAQGGARASYWDSEDAYMAGHMERAAMVIGLVVEARKLIVRGRAETGVTAIRALLSEDLALAAKVKGDDATAARFEGLTRSEIESNPTAWAEYRRRQRARG